MKADFKQMKCKKCGNTDLIYKSVKMSKSYGNTVNPGDIIEKYGADAARFFILFSASPSSGLEWSEEGVDYAHKFIKNIFLLLTSPPKDTHENLIIRDDLIKYYLHKITKDFTDNMNKLAIRNAVNSLIQFASEFSKYKNEGVNMNIFEECREKLVLLLHPIAPHITEEVWETMNKKNYISLSLWPSYEPNLLTKETEYKWNLMKNITDDINKIRLAMKVESLENISIIIADNWKYKFYNKLMKLIEETKNQGEIMKSVMQDETLKKHGKSISRMVTQILKNIGKYSKFTLTSEKEFQFFNEIKLILEKKFTTKIDLFYEKNSTQQKANQALPGKPAIIISH
jgi:leucyl-tRNA synthetase